MNITIDPWLWFMSVGLIGVCIGSFLAVIVYRLPKILEWQWQQIYSETSNDIENKLSLCWPSSHCPKCKKHIQWRYNIPLISFIMLKMRCAYCKERIDPSYFFVELTTCITWLLTAYIYGTTIHFMMVVIAISFLIALTFIDIKHKILPDEITLPLLWIGLVANSFELFTSTQDAIYGAVGGYLTLYIIQQSFAFITKRDGIGQGDIKLLAVLGAWLGWQALPGILLIASLTGILITYTFIFFKHFNHKQEIPFGPYLSLAGFIGLIFPDLINNPIMYFGLI